MYGADQPAPGAAYAWLTTSPIAAGRIKSIDTTAALAIPGVLDVLTWENVGKAVKPGKTLPDGGYNSHSVAPLYANKIYFAGQITAVVLAETPEIAQEAASAIVFTWKPTHAAATLGSPGAKEVEAKSLG